MTLWRLRASSLLAFALALALAPNVVGAQSQKAAPLRILVGFTAGGTTDQAARLLANPLREILQRPVIVENRPGASGRIAAVALKHAPADGATVMLAPVVVTVLAPLVWPRLDYDPQRDFAPVSQVSSYAMALALNDKIPARNVREFVAWAKASRAPPSYGVSAAGSLPHLFATAVGDATGLQWTAVPYRGLGPLESDLVGGQIPAAVDALSNLIELHRAGRVRIIATSGVQRSPLLPEVATFREQGIAAAEGTGWIAMYAPAGTPTHVIEELSAAIAQSLRRPDLRAQFSSLGYEPSGTTAAELAAIASRDAAYWRPIIRANGFTAE